MGNFIEIDEIDALPDAPVLDLKPSELSITSDTGDAIALQKRHVDNLFDITSHCGRLNQEPSSKCGRAHP